MFAQKRQFLRQKPFCPPKYGVFWRNEVTIPDARVHKEGERLSIGFPCRKGVRVVKGDNDGRIIRPIEQDTPDTDSLIFNNNGNDLFFRDVNLIPLLIKPSSFQETPEVKRMIP